MNQSKEYIKSIASMFNSPAKDGFCYISTFDLLLKEGICFDSKKLTRNEKKAVKDLFKTFVQPLKGRLCNRF